MLPFQITSAILASRAIALARKAAAQAIVGLALPTGVTTPLEGPVGRSPVGLVVLGVPSKAAAVLRDRSLPVAGASSPEVGTRGHLSAAATRPGVRGVDVDGVVVVPVRGPRRLARQTVPTVTVVPATTIQVDAAHVLVPTPTLRLATTATVLLGRPVALAATFQAVLATVVTATVLVETSVALVDATRLAAVRLVVAAASILRAPPRTDYFWRVL